MPSLTPPDEPGQVDDEHRPASPARPRDSIADGIPAATPAALIASAMPGISRSSTRRVISGVRSPGVRPGPAGGHHHVVAGRDRVPQRRLDRLAVRHDQRPVHRAARPRASSPASTGPELSS